MKTQPLSHVCKFHHSFRKSHIFILIFCLLCFSVELAFGQKNNKKKKDEKQENTQQENRQQGNKQSKNKVTVCHKGKTIEISSSALQAHLDHGDTEGPCSDGNLDGNILLSFNPPSIVYENIGAELSALYEQFTEFGSVPSDDIFVISGDRVLIEIIAVDKASLDIIWDALSKYDVDIHPDYHSEDDLIITVLFPIASLVDLNDDPDVEDIISFIRPVYTPILKSGFSISQGDKAIQSDNARKAFDVDGSDVKVCVMSDSYNAKQKARGDIDNGDLPLEVDVSEDYPIEFGSHFYVVDEGRAMLQIIHDIAPGAALGFRTGFVSIEHMANGIHTLQGYPHYCDIIVDDITHLAEPFFRDGLISDAVNEVTGQGVKYFSSAGNFADWGYESQFSPAPGPGNESYHDFDGAGNINQQVKFGEAGTYIIVFQWDDEYKSLGGVDNDGAQNDLDISLVDELGNTLVSLNTNNLGGDPIEVMPIKVENGAALANIVIKRSSGTENVNFKYIVFVGGQHFTIVDGAPGVSTIVGQANAAGAYTVGAANYKNTPAYGVEPPIIEPFSSYGGTLIGGIDREKPDFVAPDGVNTSVSTVGTDTDGDDPFSNFLGTSAAAPHAAAVAALISHAVTDYEVEGIDVGEKMKETALAMNETVDYDYIAGYGFVFADSAIMSFAAPKPSITGLEVPGDISPGVVDFVVTIQGENLSRNSQVLLDGNTLPNDYVTYKDHSEITATINSTITIESTVQIETPSITPSGDDGGLSDPFPIFYTPKIKITVTADDATKLFGELNPEFSATLLVEGLNDQSEIDRLAASIGFLYETSSKHWDDTEGQYCSPTGDYYINPTGIDPATIDPNTLEDYDFEYMVDDKGGRLTIEKMPITIKPITKENYIYGESFDNIGFEYDLYSDGIDDHENIDANEKIDNLELLLDYIQMEHNATFPEGVTNVIVDRGKQLVNRGKQLVNEFGWLVTESALSNRGKQLVNGDILIDLDIDLLIDYSVNPDGSIPNRGKQLVNGELFYNNDSYIKDQFGNRGKQLVNEGGLGTSESENGDFSNITLIVDTSDATVSRLFSVNLVSGLEVNPDGDPQYEGAPQYCVPGAFISPAADNFTIAYTSTDFNILPADLNVKADNKQMFFEDLVMPKFTSNFEGFQYDDNENNVFSSINFTPIEVTAVGGYSIEHDDFDFFDEINYTIVRTQGLLAVQDIFNGQIAVATENSAGLYDLTLFNSDGSNPVILVSAPGLVPGSVRDPEFSPNGKEIVFTSTDGDTFSDIWKVNSDGSGLTQLTTDGLSGLADFSPDGTHIAFIRDGDIAVMNADGSYPKIIMDTPENEWWPFYAPDGEELYFTRYTGDGINEIFKTNISPTHSNLLHWWPGDGNVFDIERGNHATLQGGATFGPGRISQAYKLDGIDDFVMVPDSPNLNFGTRDFTVDLWVNFASTDGEQIIIEKWVQKFEGASAGWTLTKIKKRMRLALSEANESEVGLDVTPPSLTINTWNHVTVTRETNTFTLYWNGSPLGTIDCPYNLNSTSSLKMGHRGDLYDTPGSQDDQGFYLNGYIDELKIFNRALALTEIQEIHAPVETQITTDNSIFYRQPDFFRDGTKILFTQADNASSDGSAIMTINPDGTGQVELYSDLVGSASGSPDNQKITFTRESDQMKFLTVMNSDGSGEQDIVEQADLQIIQPIWGTNPDGVNYVNIPDDNFEKALRDLGFDSDGTDNNRIYKSEALAVTILYISDPENNPELPSVSKKIADLTGIEAFKNLTRLHCQSNLLTSLDLSQNTALIQLWCFNNQITELDFSQNPRLNDLLCYENELTRLNVSQNSALTHLNCYGNQLEILDVSQNTALTGFSCYDNQLSILDISKNTDLTILDCAGNQLSSLNVSLNTALTYLSCPFNELTSMDVSKNTALVHLLIAGNQLTSIEISKNLALTELRCEGNQLTSLDVSPNILLSQLVCEGNHLTSLDLSQNTSLIEIDCRFNNLVNLNVRNGNNSIITSFNALSNYLSCISVDDEFPVPSPSFWVVEDDVSFSNDCEEFVYIPDSNFEQALIARDIDTYDIENHKILRVDAERINELDISGENIEDLTGIEAFSDLIHLDCEYNLITNLDVTQNLVLEELVCQQNLLTELDVSQNTSLVWLMCGHNQITGLDVSHNTALTSLYCDFNQLTSLDVSHNTLLSNLHCWNNQITSIDVRQNLQLQYLNFRENQLTNLDVSQNTALRQLYCLRNQLSSLDVSQNTALYKLWCNGNQLKSLDVTKNTALIELICDFNELTTLDVSQNTSLNRLICRVNNLTELDLTKNTALTNLDCHYNELVSLDLRNGNNLILTTLDASNNSLTCISVDDETVYHSLWKVDLGVNFSNDCELTSQLIAYYPFDGNANNVSGNNHNGIVTGASLTADRFGTPNSSYSFDGVDDKIQISDHPDFDFTDKVTISAWFKPVISSGHYVVEKAANIYGGGPYSLDYHPGTPRTVLYNESGGILVNLAGSGSSSIQVEVWQHIAFTYDGSTVKLYYNGQVNASQAATGALQQSDGNVNVGVYEFVGLYYQGNIDDIYFYNYALTDSEVEGLYTQGGWPVVPSFASSSMLSSTMVQGEITIYPNPLVNVLTVVHQNENVSNIGVIIRSDLSGKILFNANVTKTLNQFDVDLSDLASGNYILQINDGKTTEVFHIQKE